jgi:hypothetical protein
MTTQEYIANQHRAIQKLASGLPIAIAAQDTHVKMVERIFEEGKEADGSKNKYNSTDPLYVNPNNSPKKFPTKGKPNEKGVAKSKFENGQSHKTGYFESYKDFRAKIGRETGFVNLNLFGILQSDFGKGVIKVDNLKYVSTVTNEANKGKLEKFEKYFELTPEEKQNFKEVAEFEALEILRNA